MRDLEVLDLLLQRVPRRHALRPRHRRQPRRPPRLLLLLDDGRVAEVRPGGRLAARRKDGEVPRGGDGMDR